MGVETTSWQPDPYGLHELRFFSADGKPTLLVMDGGRTSYDRPPTRLPSPAPKPGPDSAPAQVPVPIQVDEPSPILVPPAATVAAHNAVLVSTTPRQPIRDHTPHSVGSEGSAAPGPAEDRSTAVSKAEPENLSHPRKIAYMTVFAALTLSVLGLAYVHLRPSGGAPSAHARGGSKTTPPSRSASRARGTTTSDAVPTALSPNANAAATALVSSWSTGNKQTALTVATPTAVAALFAVPYTSGLAIARGCSTEFSPIVCTFGPPGGASPSDAIYQILVSQAAGGWYVSSVRIEG